MTVCTRVCVCVKIKSHYIWMVKTVAIVGVVIVSHFFLVVLNNITTTIIIHDFLQFFSKVYFWGYMQM